MPHGGVGLTEIAAEAAPTGTSASWLGLRLKPLPQGPARAGPEGGWSDQELELFVEHTVPHMGLGQFTLRAETAAVMAAARVA